MTWVGCGDYTVFEGQTALGCPKGRHHSSQLSHRQGILPSPPPPPPRQQQQQQQRSRQHRNAETQSLSKSLQETLLAECSDALSNTAHTFTQRLRPRTMPPPAPRPTLLRRPPDPPRRGRPRPRPKLRFDSGPAGENGARGQTTWARPHHPRHHTRHGVSARLLAGAAARLEDGPDCAV